MVLFWWASSEVVALALSEELVLEPVQVYCDCFQGAGVARAPTVAALGGLIHSHGQPRSFVAAARARSPVSCPHHVQWRRRAQVVTRQQRRFVGAVPSRAAGRDQLLSPFFPGDFSSWSLGFGAFRRLTQAPQKQLRCWEYLNWQQMVVVTTSYSSIMTIMIWSIITDAVKITEMVNRFRLTILWLIL